MHQWNAITVNKKSRSLLHMPLRSVNSDRTNNEATEQYPSFCHSCQRCQNFEFITTAGIKTPTSQIPLITLCGFAKIQL